MRRLRKVRRLSMRKRKLSRKSRRRQQGGGTITITGNIDIKSGIITASCSDPSITLTSSKENTLVVTNITVPITNISLLGTKGVVAPSKIGGSANDTNIHIQDNQSLVYYITPSSSLYTKINFEDNVTQAQLDSTNGTNFKNGIKFTNLTASNFEMLSPSKDTFTITFTTV